MVKTATQLSTKKKKYEVHNSFDAATWLVKLNYGRGVHIVIAPAALQPICTFS